MEDYLHEIDWRAERFALFHYNSKKSEYYQGVSSGSLSYDDLYFLGLVQSTSEHLMKQAPYTGPNRKYFGLDTICEIISQIVEMDVKTAQEYSMSLSDKLAKYGPQKSEEIS